MIEEVYFNDFRNKQYKDFLLDVFYSYPDASGFSKYCCVAKRSGKLEQVRDPNGVLQVIRHKGDEINFTVSGKDVLGNEAYDSNPALAIIDIFHYKVDEYLANKEPEIYPTPNGVKTYRCSCCGTTYTTDQLGYTPTCRNCGALMKESV